MTLAYPNPVFTGAQAEGLDGITAATTILSEVDGEGGRLVLRGRPIEDLAGKLTYEEAASFFWADILRVPRGAELTARFAEARATAARALPVLQAASPKLGTYELMRLGLSALASEGADEDPVVICGSLPVFLAAGWRISQGLAPVMPDLSLRSSEDMLRMLSRKAPDARAAAAVDRYLVTILDHGFNASTFTARVIASTGADMASAVIGAMGALKGPLHGGAPGPVLDMLDAIGTSDRAERWIERALKDGKRLMGFGHRIYRTRDPRADVLKAGLAELPSNAGRLILAQGVEQAALAALARHKPDRPLQTNVEYYTAVMLEAAGMDRSLFTPLFAVGRAIGWCGHVAEQRATGRLIRPASRYVGPVAA